MTWMRRRALAGAPHGTHVLAARQTAGRGRRGRTWHSVQAGVYLTLLLRPPPGVIMAGLPLAFGLAAHDAVRALAAACGVAELPGLGLKWPNDLLVGTRKLGGVLLEAEHVSRSNGWILVGLGLNVAPRQQACLAPELDGRYIGMMDLLPAKSMGTRTAQDAMRTYTEALASHTLAACFDAWSSWQKHGLAHVTRRWAAVDVLSGHTVEAQHGPQRVRGYARGVGPCGRLRLQTAAGELLVHSGEVFDVTKPCGPGDACGLRAFSHPTTVGSALYGRSVMAG